jgi:hypothetical protein
VRQLILTETAHVSLTGGPNTNRYRPRTVLNGDAVKIEQLAIITAHHSIAPVIVERGYHTGDHQLASEP